MPSSSSHAGGYTTTTGTTSPGLGGVVLWGGSVSSVYRNINRVQGLAQVGVTKTSGPNLVQTANAASFTTVSRSGGRFNYQAAGNYLVYRLANTINGVASTLMLSGAGDYGRSDNNYYRSPFRTRRIVLTGGWNYVTGRPINAVDAIDTFTVETFPTRQIPGHLLYIQTGKSVKVDNYRVKNT